MQTIGKKITNLVKCNANIVGIYYHRLLGIIRRKAFKRGIGLLIREIAGKMSEYCLSKTNAREESSKTAVEIKKN